MLRKFKKSILFFNNLILLSRSNLWFAHGTSSSGARRGAMRVAAPSNVP